MFDQQLDIFGDQHDVAPATVQPKLFDSGQQLRGQIALETDENTPEFVEARRAMFQAFGWTRP